MPVAVRTKKFTPKPANPQADPRFQKVKEKVGQKAVQLKKHPPAKQKANEAAKAAKGPPNEKSAGAKSNQVDALKDTKAQTPPADSFLTVLRAEIDKVMPSTVEDAGNFMDGGAEDQMKGAVGGNVKDQKETASGDLQKNSAKPPNEGGVPTKPVEAVPPDPNAPTPSVDGGGGMPAPKPDAEITEKQTKADAQTALKENRLEGKRLENKDPRFEKVKAEKGNVDKTADASPNKYRAGEKQTLGKAAAQANAQARGGMTALSTVKNKSKSAVSARQEAQKQKDEARRKAVTDRIEAIYTETKIKVDTNLNSLEKDVMAIFDPGCSSAIASFKSNTNREIDKFYDKRYSGLSGAAQWVIDKFKDTPPEVKQIIQNNLKGFTASMDALAVRVANFVDKRLNKAKTDIEAGQGKIKAFVASLPKDLKSVGQEAEKAMESRFNEMRDGIESKKNDLAQKLAQKYKEAHDQANELAKKIEEENQGAFKKLADAVGEVIKIILEFKDKLMALLKKAADAIELILDDPIGFLGNLIGAVKQGVNQFVSNIWTHLKAGFMKWLFGALADAGIEIPTDLSLVSIFKLVMGVLGLTYAKMRAKAVKLLGPTAVAVIEKLIEYVKDLIEGGPAKLWEHVKADIGDLKNMVIDAIQSWLIETVIKQAAIKLLSFFNPAGAFVQAVLAIYNTVVFIIENASKIMAFVEAVINSVSSIAQGAIGAAASWIEKSLASIIPLVIGFLARLIGLGGISKKIKEFITKVQDKVDKAIDKAIAKVVGIVKKLFGKMTGKGKKDDKRTDKEKEADLKKAVTEVNAGLKDEGRRKAAEKVLKKVKQKYKLTRADIVLDETKKGTTFFHAELEINPIAKSSKAGEMDFIDPAISVTPAFFCKKSLNKTEFARQIGVQKETMNNMNVHQWLANRNKFIKEGRSAEGTKKQRKMLDDAYASFRAKVIKERSKVYKKKPLSLSDAAALSKAEGFVNKLLAYTMTPSGRRRYKNSQMTDSTDGKVYLNELFKKAAAHKLDQVAGGEGTDLEDELAGAREDFSLGAQWKGARIETLQKNVEKEVKGKKANERKEIRMNVDFPVTYE
ncbi:MAG TPA: polymorphic toxin type 15 domain-containing protein [Pyrinomonadaceae bacterium]|nr:polymorphic toxin type 15 domain-containing protein [Pyrinomonadaceae bacterium]